MHLLIDANNLAGALGLLEHSDFNDKLIDIIKEYNTNRGNLITLVFDGVDLMGDRYLEDRLTVIHTPRDGYYNSADDKIIELSDEHFKVSNDELKIITDDIELKERLKERNSDKGAKFVLVQASDFANLLRPHLTEMDEDDDRGLSDGEINDINKELLDLWTR